LFRLIWYYNCLKFYDPFQVILQENIIFLRVITGYIYGNLKGNTIHYHDLVIRYPDLLDRYFDMFDHYLHILFYYFDFKDN
jgi:hypothetical protein